MLKIFIETYGCQMNVSDSGKIVQLFADLNYQLTTESRAADLIIINTCSVREKPELKLFSALGRYIPLKRKRPELVIAVGGCVAQQWGEQLLERCPGLDIVFGTHQLDTLPELVSSVRDSRKAVSSTAFRMAPGGLEVMARPQPQAVSAMVTIMQGCDNFCSYCIVPHVRGREYSRPSPAIIEEVSRLADAGIKEVMLLGQNVNSYGLKEPGEISFAQLLGRVNEIEGIERIRFTTSHPKDMSDELIAAFASLSKLCPSLHLPLQAGSDTVLKRMGRRYTAASYLEKVAKLREIVPDVALTTDIIVGFPGESEDDFQQTLKMLEKVGYDQIYSFKYSSRPGTKAADYEDMISDDEKRERLARCQALQDSISQRLLKAQVGKVSEVLVTGPSKRGAGEWSGRTRESRIVNFSKPSSPEVEIVVGGLYKVSIIKALKHSLKGEVVADGNP
ncbi:MAG: tRNA (N6-isopentenyl adenosine(37)-C2)-methylthiotransferase MiaB [Deltaproteobacteria bacterium]|nr:tRNA (N6-isopentenyl adenosine(37)-C2)-methylthiotransferase MiaB [Deltaproteobacteria bacterium]